MQDELFIDPEPSRIEVIDQFRVEKELGRGGMGTVYKVHAQDGEIYALKIMSQKEAINGDSWKRFQREMKLLQDLNHPNIIRIHGTGEYLGCPYFLMDYLEGVALSDYQRKKKRLGPKEAVHYIWKIALALSSVNRLGILHRDVKPGNILLVDKKPYLMDFGVSCRYSGDSNADEGRITTTGTIIGTPNYMSPEQAQAETEEMGPWSDVYSLGATLYHLVTGVLPFKGKSELDVLINLNEKELRPASKYNPNVSKDLELVIQKATMKDTRQRYQSAEEFASDLRALLRGKKISITYKTLAISKDKDQHANMILIVSIFLLFAAIALLVWKTSSSGSRTNKRVIDPTTIEENREKPEKKK